MGLANQQEYSRKNRIITRRRFVECHGALAGTLAGREQAAVQRTNITGSEPVIRQHFPLVCQSLSWIPPDLQGIPAAVNIRMACG